ncbi:MAG: hypothetical protein LBV30_02185, partial [Propionibacteriaceae bacterium]|nr:hypothetical protein [Propionibacteriaceae bacterium]
KASPSGHWGKKTPESGSGSARSPDTPGPGGLTSARNSFTRPTSGEDRQHGGTPQPKGNNHGQ